MSKSRKLTIALIVMLLALAAGAWIVIGQSAGISYANADKYTAGNTVVTGNVENLDVNWTAGSVTVEYYAGTGIEVSETAKRDLSDDEKLHWWLDGTTLRIQYDKPAFRLNWSFTDNGKALTIRLPEGTVLKKAEIGATSADVTVPELKADKARLASTSGDIKAGLETKDLEAASTSGSVTITVKGEAEEIKAGSTSGSIGLTVDSAKKIEAGSTSGGISLKVTGSADKIKLGATSGNVYAEFPRAGKAELGSTSGTVSVTAEAFDEMEIGATSGNVTVTLPAGLGFTCRVETASGDFSSDLQLKKDGKTYVSGDGSAKLEIGTASGDVRIEEKK